MKRIIVHWTGGGGRANAVDRQHYHRLVEYDGTIVAGTEEIADNVVTSDGDYAAHTRNLNTDSIGIALCGMQGATEYPFDPGPSPLTDKQWRAACILISDLAREYSIPVTPQTVLTHAEVEPTLGVKQIGKWDITRLPFKPQIVGALPVGHHMRQMVREILGDSAPETQMPTLRMGSRRFEVHLLQANLKELGYHLGRVDGIFGRRTRASVMAFQADHGLVVDGIAGPQTWAAFDQADPMPKREVTEGDLEDADDPVVKATKRTEKALSTAEGGALTAVSVGGAIEIAKAAGAAEGALETAQRILLTYWPVLLLIAGVLIVSRYGKRLLRYARQSHVEDARDGKFLGG